VACKITGGDEDMANDIVQEMYIKIHDRLENKKLPKLQYLTKSYVYLVLKSIFIDIKRQNKEIPTIDFTDEDNTDYEKLDQLNELREVLKTIPFLHREVLLQTLEKGQRNLSKETGVCRQRLRSYKNTALEIIYNHYGKKETSI